MKRADWFTKVLLALIAAGLWVLILRPVFTPTAIRAAAGIPAVVRAHRFELADSGGRVRASIGFWQPRGTEYVGDPQLALLDLSGRVRASVGLDLGGGRLQMLDENGVERATIRLIGGSEPILKLYGPRSRRGTSASLGFWMPGDTPEVAFWDETGVIRATMSGAPASEGTGPSLDLYDKQGKSRASLALGSDGAPSLDLGDKYGKRRAGLLVGADGTPMLGMTDKDSALRFYAGVKPDGHPALSLYGRYGGSVDLGGGEVPEHGAGMGLSIKDKAGAPRVVLDLLHGDTPVMAMWDKDGKVMWQAPPD